MWPKHSIEGILCKAAWQHGTVGRELHEYAAQELYTTSRTTACLYTATVNVYIGVRHSAAYSMHMSLLGMFHHAAMCRILYTFAA